MARVDAVPHLRPGAGAGGVAGVAGYQEDKAMTEEEARRLLFDREYEPFKGYKDALRALEIYEETMRIYSAALATTCPLRTYTTDNTAPTKGSGYE